MAYARKKKHLMQQFSLSLNVPERIRKGYVWSVTYSIKCVIDNLSYCKTNLHWVESTSMGAHQLQGGGLCLKALPSSICLLAWLCCLSSSTVLQRFNFFSFNFVLIFFLYCADFFGYLTLYNCTMICIYGRWWYDMDPLVMLRCTY